VTHQRPVTVVGIGENGWSGLGDEGRAALSRAREIVGSTRQLALLPEGLAARTELLPSPLLPGLETLLAASAEPLCLLASGDPMLHGIGATIARMIPPADLRVIPAVSSVTLACARLGWAEQSVEVVSAVSQPVQAVHPAVSPGARILVLSRDGATPAAVAALLVARGYGSSEVTVLEHLGGPSERQISGQADAWPAEVSADLNIVAVQCGDGVGADLLSRNGGLPDDAYDHDGALTKQEVRAVTMAALAPGPGQLLWDVGAGSGSIGVEWMRLHPSAHAIAIEAREDRSDRISRNALNLGVPALQVVTGRAPEVLEGLAAPDAVFVGGGVSVPGVLEACWDALRPGGRLVANAVTLETDALLAQWHAGRGGELVRLAVSRAGPLGGFTAWRPQLPVTIWKVRRT
jgi:precorrin-6Y C5,15-methyltransferase (decarboxylating)